MFYFTLTPIISLQKIETVRTLEGLVVDANRENTRLVKNNAERLKIICLLSEFRRKLACERVVFFKKG